MKNAGRIFGQGLKFPPEVGPDGRLMWSAGADNIREAIRIILSTEPGERLRLPQFGGGFGRFLFEPNTVTTRQRIQERIIGMLGAWEPRIQLDSVSVEQDPLDPQAAVAVIQYKLVATQARDTLRLKVALGAS
ncbi:MAG: phage tail protein [Nitrospirae bacterium GWC2_56_14]|nr:MAG: phage tail protein [Nitrospirae bacterium GWC2_56_14]